MGGKKEMPAKLDRCVNDLMKDPGFKPRKEGQTKKQAAYAVCTNMLKKSKKTEKLENVVLEYNVPIIETVKEDKEDNKYFISGTAIEATVSRNNIKYVAEELEKAAPTLVGKPILDSHNRDTVKAILGKVTNASFNEGKIPFEGNINDKEVKIMISDGRISNVSIGAQVGELIKEVIENEDGEVIDTYFRAKDIEFLELSLVSVPGVASASLDNAISEAFNKSSDKIKKEEIETHLEENKMEDFKEILQSALAPLNEKISSLSEELTKLKEEAEEEETEEEEEEEETEEEESVSKVLTEDLKVLEEKVKKFEEEKLEGKGEVKEETVTEEKKDKSNFVFEKNRDGAFFYVMPDIKGEVKLE